MFRINFCKVTWKLWVFVIIIHLTIKKSTVKPFLLDKSMDAIKVCIGERSWTKNYQRCSVSVPTVYNFKEFLANSRKLTMCSKETEVKTKPQKTVPFGDTRPTDRADNLRWLISLSTSSTLCRLGLSSKTPLSIFRMAFFAKAIIDVRKFLIICWKTGKKKSKMKGNKSPKSPKKR